MLVMAKDVCSTLNCWLYSWSRWDSYSRFCFSTCRGGEGPRRGRGGAEARTAESGGWGMAAALQLGLPADSNHGCVGPPPNALPSANSLPFSADQSSQSAPGKGRRRTTSARRLAASCAGPGRVFLMMSLCLASCSSNLRIFSSRLQQAREGVCVGEGARDAQALDRRVDSLTHLSPRVLSLSTASSIVGAGIVGFLPPNSRFMAPEFYCARRLGRRGAGLFEEGVRVLGGRWEAGNAPQMGS